MTTQDALVLEQETTMSCFQVLPTNDSIVEGDEEFVISLSASDSAITANSTAVLTIVDDDGKYYFDAF